MQPRKLDYEKTVKKLKINNVRFWNNHKKRTFLFSKRCDINISESPITLEPYCRFHQSRSLWSMMAFSYSSSTLPLNTEVGRYCSIAGNVKVMGFQHPLDLFTTSDVTYNPDYDGILPFKRNEINYNPYFIAKNDVWIGEDVKIKSGVTIGNGAVIGANAVVTKDVPDYAIVAGSPARIIRMRFPDEDIESLLRLKWWRYNIQDFPNFDINMKIKCFISYIEDQSTKIDIYKPRKIEI